MSFLFSLPTLPPASEDSQGWPGAAQDRQGGHIPTQAWSFSGNWVQQLSPKIAGGGATFEQAEMVREP